jgi:hypothetical protein
MHQATGAIALEQPAREEDDPARGFANAILLALPLWGLIGLAAWAVL